MNSIRIKNADDMEAFGAQLAHQVKAPYVIFLKGDLGAGKTTLVRGFLRELGYKGIVKSPTYTLVESYELEDKMIHHFDLYRLRVAHELEMMGFLDYFDHNSICLIEWPEIAEGYLKQPDIYCTINSVGSEREIKVL